MRRLVAVAILVLGLAATCAGCGGLGCGAMAVHSEYTADWSTVQASEGVFVTSPASQEMSEDDYKDYCEHVSYKDFRTDTEAHKGEDVYFIGPVTVVGEAVGSRIIPPTFGGALEGCSALALGMGPRGDGGIGEYDSAVIVVWPGPLPDIPQGSIVAVWGESQGAYGDFPESIPKDAVVRGVYLTWYMP